MSRGSWLNYGSHAGKLDDVDIPKLPKYFDRFWEEENFPSNSDAHLSYQVSSKSDQELEDVSLENPNNSENTNNRHSTSSGGRWLALMLTIFGCALTLKSGLLWGKGMNQDNVDFRRKEQLKFGFSSSTSYSHDSGQGYPWLKDSIVVEPYKATLFSVTDSGGDFEDGGHDYIWRICGEDTVYHGRTVEMLFKEPGEKEITLEKLSPTDHVISHAKQKVHIAYVRREIRTLSDPDLEAFLDAMEILYRVPQRTGQLLYGDRYRDIGYFTALHMNLTRDKECDHLHEGMGFIPGHMALTFAFEKALQVVNPSVTIPFWDFTIEATQVARSGGDMSYFYNSKIFTDDVMGAFPEESGDGQLKSGRWANIPVSAEKWPSAEGVPTNAFGMLRTAWNPSPLPHLSRSKDFLGFDLNSIPDCAAHADQLALDDWEAFAKNIEGAPHASLHTLIGGSFGADYKAKLAQLGYSKKMLSTIQKSGLLGSLSRKMWRANLFQCPKECEEKSLVSSDCKCTCPELDLWTSSGQSESILSSISTVFDDKSMLANAKGEDISHDILRLFCNNEEDLHPYFGDAMNAGTPLDPMFWVIHPTIDRLYHWRKINGFSTEDWPNDDGSYCFGHGKADGTEIALALMESNYGDAVVTTNEEIMQFLNPISPKAPYIYDNFVWKHCITEGFQESLLPNQR